jgi:hypothetical protein
MRTRLAAVVIVVVILVAVGCHRGESGGSGGSTRGTGKTVGQVSTAPTPDEDVEAGELYLEFRKNELAAEQKYRGKLTAVSGVVSMVRRDGEGRAVVVLVPQRGDGRVMCYLDPRHQAEAADLVVREPGTVVGRVKGRVFRVGAGDHIEVTDGRVVWDENVTGNTR